MATLKEDALILGGVAVGVVLIAWYLKRSALNLATSAGDLFAEAVPYVNPASDKNLAYQGASSFMRLLTGNTTTTDTVGTMLWDYMHKGEPDPNGGLINYTAEQQAADRRATQQLENAGRHGL